MLGMFGPRLRSPLLCIANANVDGVQPIVVDFYGVPTIGSNVSPMVALVVNQNQVGFQL